MHDSKYPERVERLNEYLTSELTARKNAGTHYIMRSRIDQTALIQLFKCAKKNEASLEGLVRSGDEEIADSVRHIVRNLDIADYPALVKWASRVEHDSESLIKMEHDGKNAVSRTDFIYLVRNKDMSDRKARYYLRMVMTLFAQGCSEDFSPRSMLAEYLEIAHPQYIKRMYNMLLLTLAPKQKSDDENQPQQQQTAPASQEITDLQEQIDSLKAELEATYIRLNASEENYDTLQKEGHEAAVNEVLGLLNSPASGTLLDQFANAEKSLKDFHGTIPDELSSLSLCVKIFSRTMRNVFGVTPVCKVGDILTITFEQSERYIYSGSDFIEDGETKKVEVIAPGWKRGDEIFSLPKVIERIN